MNKALLIAAILGVMTSSFSAHSALTLSGTRYVYTSDSKAIPINVTNHADTPYGAQVWIESQHKNESIPFSVSPGIFTLKANKGMQTVQVAQLETNALPQDRESLFFVNLQEIPPKRKDALEENVLVMAARTVVKLFYRPAALNEGRENAEQNIRVSRTENTLTFTNPTPYYFALLSINGDEKLATAQLNQLAPFTQAVTQVKNFTSSSINFKAIDDYGGAREYHCDLNKQQQQCQRVSIK